MPSKKLNYPRYLGCPFCIGGAEPTKRVLHELADDDQFALEYQCRENKNHKFLIEVKRGSE
jgi:hypothetical protein